MKRQKNVLLLLIAFILLTYSYAAAQDTRHGFDSVGGTLDKTYTIENGNSQYTFSVFRLNVGPGNNPFHYEYVLFLPNGMQQNIVRYGEPQAYQDEFDSSLSDHCPKVQDIFQSANGLIYMLVQEYGSVYVSIFNGEKFVQSAKYQGYQITSKLYSFCEGQVKEFFAYAISKSEYTFDGILVFQNGFWKIHEYPVTKTEAVGAVLPNDYPGGNCQTEYHENEIPILTIIHGSANLYHYRHMGGYDALMKEIMNIDFLVTHFDILTGEFITVR